MIKTASLTVDSGVAVGKTDIPAVHCVVIRDRHYIHRPQVEGESLIAGNAAYVQAVPDNGAGKLNIGIRHFVLRRASVLFQDLTDFRAVIWYINL